MVSLALSLDRSTWNGQITVKAGFSLFPVMLFFFNLLLCFGAVHTVERFPTSFLLMSTAYLVNLMQLSLWELDSVDKEDSEELFSIASTAQEHQMTFTVSPFDQPHAALPFLIILSSLTAFYTIGTNVIVGSGFILTACASSLALHQLMFPSHFNSSTFDFWTEWTGLKLCKMLVPALLKDRSQQSEVRSHYIFGLLDDERETNEEKSLIWEAEHLDRVDEVGVGENNVQNQGAKVEGLKVKGPEFGVVVDSKTDEDEWEYITNISLYVKESQSVSWRLGF